MEKKFETIRRKRKIPQCLDAIDEKHLMVQTPDNSETLFFKYKNSLSVVLMACSDANYMFTVIEVGDYGYHSDGGVLNASLFGQSFDVWKIMVTYK